jgi:hypothetical protein
MSVSCQYLVSVAQRRPIAKVVNMFHMSNKSSPVEWTFQAAKEACSQRHLQRDFTAAICSL